MQKFNYHSHTYRCMHSDADMLDEDYIKDYIKMGFEEVAFTDHCPEKNIIDKRPRIRMLYDQRIEYLQSIQNLKEKYKDKIIIIDWLLLPNSKYFDMCDVKILLDIPYEIRKKRAMKRDNITEEAFDLREQASINFDVDAFNYVIKTNNEETVKRLVKLL